MTVSVQAARRARPAGGRGVEWRTRYAGVVAIAHVGGRAIAGISGPWSGRFALTWWERPLPARQLLLFDTLDEAKREVESWALRMRVGRAGPLPGCGADAAVPARLPTLVERARTLVAEMRGTSVEAASTERVRDRAAVDLDDLHFAAHD
ncbi:MAG TPA: hypothetical protein VGC30_03235 [Dokdonella sp.]